MESSTEQVRQEPVDSVQLKDASTEDAKTDLVVDEYAQSELETRKRRIELSIQKAMRAT